MWVGANSLAYCPVGEFAPNQVKCGVNEINKGGNSEEGRSMIIEWTWQGLSDSYNSNVDLPEPKSRSYMLATPFHLKKEVSFSVADAQLIK